MKKINTKKQLLKRLSTHFKAHLKRVFKRIGISKLGKMFFDKEGGSLNYTPMFSIDWDIKEKLLKEAAVGGLIRRSNRNRIYITEKTLYWWMQKNNINFVDCRGFVNNEAIQKYWTRLSQRDLSYCSYPTFRIVNNYVRRVGLDRIETKVIEDFFDKEEREAELCYDKTYKVSFIDEKLKVYLYSFLVVEGGSHGEYRNIDGKYVLTGTLPTYKKLTKYTQITTEQIKLLYAAMQERGELILEKDEYGCRTIFILPNEQITKKQFEGNVVKFNTSPC